MRRLLTLVVCCLTLVALVTPVSAQAPAPKVTINGLLDFVVGLNKNVTGLDPTNARDQEWYSRERGRFTITGEVGATKAVWGTELDFTNGCVDASSGTSSAGSGGCSRTHSGTSSSFDLDTDVAGVVETKWLYVETPATGPGSLLPFIPVRSKLRAGAQPARGHAYKAGILWSGDFPGVSLETTWAPNVRSTLTYAQIGEQLDQTSFAGATEDWALLASVEVDVFKGLTVKPTYVYSDVYGGNTGSAGLGSETKNGFNVRAAPGTYPLRTTKHTIGGDLRWSFAGFTLQPTFLYQVGTQSVIPAVSDGKSEVDINAWIFDVIGGYRIGPLNLEGRFAYTPGMKATECVTSAGGCPAGSRGHDINYYQAINPGFIYMAGWSEIQTSATDYSSTALIGAPGVALRVSPSFDKYGRIFAALAADYSLTPKFTLNGIVNTQWAAEKVDTDGTLSANGLTSPTDGDDRHIATELVLGFTYRFAPNVTFVVAGAYLWAHDALANANTGTTHDPHDMYELATRIRFTF